MEVGPTTHYIMGGVRVDPDTQMSRLPGLFAAGECAAGINGANRLGGNSLSDLLVFGKRAGEFAAQFAKQNSLGEIRNDQIDLPRAKRSLHSTGATARTRTQIQKDLQEVMQDNVGIVRTESEMQNALGQLQQLKQRANHAAVTGNREYNPGWHTTIDLKNLLTVSEAITRAAIERKESRGAQFREDYPDKDERFSKVNTIVSKATDGSMQDPLGAVTGNAGLFKTDYRGDEMSLTGGTAGLGSARVPRAGCGVPPQRDFSETLFSRRVFAAEKSSRTPGDVRQRARGVRSPETSIL